MILKILSYTKIEACLEEDNMQISYSVVIFDKNIDSVKIIKSYLENINSVVQVEIYSDYMEGFGRVKQNPENVIVILDITDIDSDVSKIAEKLRLYTRKIIITSVDCSVDTIVQALRMGGKEFLPKPVLQGDLTRAIDLMTTQNSDDNFSESKILTVYSNKGGIGKTTIATNLAIELAKTTKEKIALVDLNLQLGDISTFLNLNPSFDINYFIKKLLKQDAQNLIKLFEQYKNTSLYVLSDPTYIEHAENITPQQINSLFMALKKVFPYIVVDMSSGIDANTLKILDSSDWILFTTNENIPAIRNCQRCLNLFNSRKYPKDKVKIIINRYMENDEIKLEDIENTLGEKIYWKIPNNYFTIMDAINKGCGVSEINSSSNVANNFRDFASKVSDEIIEQSVIQYRR